MVGKNAALKVSQPGNRLKGRSDKLTPDQYGISLARIGFGIAWAVAAILKWQPNFIQAFSDTVSGAADGQAAPIQQWITFWGSYTL